MFLQENERIVGREAEKCSFLHSGPVAGAESPPILMADDLLRMTESVARTRFEGRGFSRLPALAVLARRCAPSPGPLRLVKATAAGHPLPRGERAGELRFGSVYNAGLVWPFRRKRISL